MPAISPYPQLPMNQRQVQQPSNFYFPHIRTNIEMKSQASNNSNESSGGSDQRRKYNNFFLILKTSDSQLIMAYKM